MTASTFTLPEPLPATTLPLGTPHPNFFRAWTSSFLVYFFPAQAGRLWLNVSIPRAIAVALINFAIAPLWFLLLITGVVAWNTGELFTNPTLVEYKPHPLHLFLTRFETLPEQTWSFIADHFALIDTLAGAVLLALTFLTTLGILFFVLLPFAARPGPNKPCTRHVLRAVLLSSGWVHLWGPILSAAFIFFIARRYAEGLENIIAPLTSTLMLLTLWSLLSLIAAARQDYRSPKEFPQPRDPFCEECGYNLSVSPPDARCPECGKPVAESTAPDTRPPTPWERRPSLANFPAIRRQLALLITQPRTLFFSMPTLSGQRAAQRWLAGSILAVGLLATLILPAFNLEFLLTGRPTIELPNLLLGSLAIGLTWAILALMMVGIETAGIATFSRMKAKADIGPGGVYLASAAKVTAYSSTLMLPWVVLGGAQLLLSDYLNLTDPLHTLIKYHITLRTLQFILAASLSIAHIGGLLWYELTVYRGIRAIQYANK